ncbi:glutamate racemase [Treponema pectinovorum]|uniref:glutamate racemase n=1 Tax=Treponema pectinovorum TaxID=164 RepID=UPI003D934B10
MDLTLPADFAFLDSGTGGIPYMLALKEKQPQKKCVYLGDTEHFPYGEKSEDEIKNCAKIAVSLIVKKWAPKTLIVACNTISVTALDFLRGEFPLLPIVGTVPAIKLAAQITKNKKIGFLATNASVNSPYSQKLIDDFAWDCEVLKRGDPKLISFIERDFFTADENQKIQAVKPAVDFFKKNGCDTIILGCTHFTHIADIMQKLAGNGIKVIDSREGVSNQAIRLENSILKKNIETDFCKSQATRCHNQNAIEPFKDLSFYVTKAEKKETLEYKSLCQKLNITWGGIAKP